MNKRGLILKIRGFPKPWILGKSSKITHSPSVCVYVWAVGRFHIFFHQTSSFMVKFIDFTFIHTICRQFIIFQCPNPTSCVEIVEKDVVLFTLNDFLIWDFESKSTIKMFHLLQNYLHMSFHYTHVQMSKLVIKWANSYSNKPTHIQISQLIFKLWRQSYWACPDCSAIVIWTDLHVLRKNRGNGPWVTGAESTVPAVRLRISTPVWKKREGFWRRTNIHPPFMSQ